MTAHLSASLPRTALLAVCLLSAVHRLPAEDHLAGDEGLTTPVPMQAAANDAPAAPQIAATPGADHEHPLRPAIRVAAASLKVLDGLQDYEARLTKRERIEGKLLTQVMQLKLRESPFSVYLSYEGSHAGREVLFVRGQNNDQIWTHEGAGLRALVGTVALAPNAAEAMQDSRYPVVEIGMRKMLQTVIDQWTMESRYGEISVKYYPNARLNERTCRVIEASHPRLRNQFKFHMTRLFIESQTNLPVRVEQYGFPATPEAKPPLEEESTYADIRPNVGLTDQDFSRDHPDYQF